MLLRALNDNLLGRFTSITEQNDTVRKKGIFALNLALAAVWRSATWPFRKRLGQLTLIPRYTTGTCSITQFDGTNDSTAKTVTFSTALPSYMVGRFFQPKGGFTWYKIVATSGVTTILDTPVVDASASGVTFQIWKRFYYVKSEVDFVTDAFNWDGGSMLDYRSDTRLTYDGANMDNEGNPLYMGDFGIDPYDDTTYTVGTVSAPANSNVFTGAGNPSPVWLGNVNTGDILKQGTNEFYVKRVESDTSIITYNNTIDAIPANSVYTIRKNNPIGLQFYYTSDKYRVIDYTYLTKPYELHNEDYDLFPMDLDYVKVVLDRAEIIMLKDIDKDKWQSQVPFYVGELQELMDKKGAVRQRNMQFYPTIPMGILPGRGWPL